MFTGVPYTGDGKVILSKTTGEDIGFPGWNLIGNPFGTAATINKAFYRMNPETHADIIAADNNTVEAMEGIFVVATTNGEIITFNKVSRANGNDEERIVLNLNHNGTIIDRVILRFGEGEALPKFQLSNNNTKIYIPQDGMDYAMVNVGRDGACTVSTEIPVNFKATENGVYTLTISKSLNSQFSILNLIDHLTGNDIDLLQTPSYTFTAKTTDPENRFKLAVIP